MIAETVGVTGVAKLVLQVLRRVLPRRPGLPPFGIVLDQAAIEIRSQDTGSISFQLRVINKSRKTWWVDHLELTHWRLGSSTLPRQSSWLNAREELPPWEDATVWISIDLGRDGVRDVLVGIEPARSPKASPEARFEGSAVLVFRRKKRQTEVPFSFARNAIELVVPEPLASLDLN